MTQSFDEFLAERGYIRGYKHDYQTAYDYGAQSKQAEIDELRKRIDEAIAMADESCGVNIPAFVKLNKILKGIINE
jgi:hypothetical protein